jgi:hypothetical protein
MRLTTISHKIIREKVEMTQLGRGVPYRALEETKTKDQRQPVSRKDQRTTKPKTVRKTTVRLRQQQKESKAKIRDTGKGQHTQKDDKTTKQRQNTKTETKDKKGDKKIERQLLPKRQTHGCYS